MLARPASQPGGFSPVERPQVSVAADGTLAAIHEAWRVTLIEIPGGAAFAEIGVDPDALASEIGWIGTPPRLLVLSRYAAHSTAHLLDPSGPRTIAEIRLEYPMRLFATVGAAALAVGSVSAVVVTATESHLMPYQFPSRIVPVAAGAAAGQFVVALAGSIEEWDPQSRLPKRRLRLPRAAAITAVGGSERVVWMTTQQEPARIDVISLVNRGQPKAHDLPEPIAHIAGHPRSDLVTCIGAETGRLYIVDLDGRAKLRVIAPDDIERIETAALIIGRMTGVIAAQTQRPIAIMALNGRELDPEAASSSGTIVLPRNEPTKKSSLTDEPGEGDEPGERGDRNERGEPGEPRGADERGPARSAVTASSRQPTWPAQTSQASALQPPPATSARPAASGAPVSALFRHPTTQPGLAKAGPVAGKPVQSANERFSTWRDLVRQNQSRVEPVATALPPAAPPPPPAAPPPQSEALPPRSEAPQSWRDEVVAWSRAVTSGAMEYAAPAGPAIDAVIARFDLSPQLRPVLVLLYGAHLCGERGVAPVDVSRVLDRQWDEALGRGELAQRGVASYAGSRVALSPVILRVLDELPPVTGTLVGEPGVVALLGPCVVVAGDEPLPAIAERYLSHVGGAILAARGEPGRADLFFEARACGAAPMLRISASLDPAPVDPAIFVVGDAELADRLDVPRLA